MTSSAAPQAQRLRVAWVLDAASMGGAEAYVLRLINGLDMESTVVAMEPVPAEFAVALQRCGLSKLLMVLPPVRNKFDLPALCRLVGRVRASGAQLVHVNANMPTNARYGLAAAWLAGLPTLVTVHTCAAVAAGLQRRLLSLLYGRCAAVIAVSREVEQQLLGLGARPERTFVIHNGVAPAVMAQPAPSPTLRVGALGRLTGQKGFDILIDAVRLLLERGVSVTLTIGGTGPEHEALVAQGEGLPVSLVGHVEDLAGWWDGIDVACLPSRHEGVPFVLLEAMAACVPVVVADVGDVAAVVGDAAIVVKPEDPVALADGLQTLGDPLRRSVLGAAGRARVESALSLTAMLRRTAAAYTKAGYPVTVRS